MYATVNNIQLYYEVVGEGKPVILLHGNGEDCKIFSVLANKLSPNFKVYSIDTRGHGHSTPTNCLSYNLMCEDIAEFIVKNNIDKPLLYGFSDGGIIGLMIAGKYPDMLSKLIVCGANSSPQGLKFKWRFLIRASHFFTRSAKLKMMLKEPNIKESDLAKIKIPVLVTAGEKDMIKKSNTEFIAHKIKSSQLIILPKETHSSYVINSSKLYDITKKFIYSS